MKKLILSCFLLCWSVCLFAQRSNGKDTIIRADTINVRGVVYDYEGKPVKNMNLFVQLYNYREGTAKTDSNGYFEIKGAYPNGGIKLLDDRYYYANFPFRGSRYMVIYLPPPLVINIPRDSFIVKAVRKYPKVIPSVKEKLPGPDVETCFDCGPGEPPNYPGIGVDYTKFMNAFRDNLIYPSKALDNNIEGLVEIEFTIEKGGVPANFKILKGIGYGCDEDVIELVKKSKWHAGIYNGKFITTPILVSVKFELTDK
jgi:TonB family protein